MGSLKLGLSLLGGIVAVGTASIAGAYHFGVFSSKITTIRDLLRKDKYTLLRERDTSHQSHWKKSLDEYKKKHLDKSPYDEGNIKELCRSLLVKKDSYKSGYDQARKYCVIPRTIGERLKDLELNSLSTTDSKSELTEKWKKLSAEYKRSGEGSKKLSDLNKSTIGDVSVNGDHLKNKCGEVIAKEHWEENYDSLLENAQRWCTEEGFRQLPT